MTEMHWVAVVLGAGLGSYALRAAPFSCRAFRDFGRRHLRCLTYISFAVAAGIISRAIFLSGGLPSLGAEAWIKTLAVLAALAVFRITRSMPAALFSAVALATCVYWLLSQAPVS